jgi:hypothetical protein
MEQSESNARYAWIRDASHAPEDPGKTETELNIAGLTWTLDRVMCQTDGSGADSMTPGYQDSVPYRNLVRYFRMKISTNFVRLIEDALSAIWRGENTEVGASMELPAPFATRKMENTKGGVNTVNGVIRWGMPYGMHSMGS